MYIPWFGDTYEPDILQCVTATYTGDQHGEVWVDFQEQYSKAHTEIQNGHWERVDVQPAGATYTAGNGISIDANNEISVADPVLVNNSTSGTSRLAVGSGASAAQNTAQAFGTDAKANSNGSLAVGYNVQAQGNYSTAINGSTGAVRAIQLGYGSTNSDANTFKVANANGNFEIMSADGTIPEARLADTTNAQQGDVLTLDANGDAVWQAGGGGGLQNTATGTESLTVLGTATTQNYAVNIGVLSQANGQQATAIGRNAVANRNSIAIGCDSQAGSYSTAIGGTALGTSWLDPRIAIGRNAVSGADYAIQIGADQVSGTTNSDSKTVKIYNGNGNFEIMSADGTMPADRLTHAINKYASMPTASASNEGWIVQFTGTTDSMYTHGYIYECVGTTAQGSATAAQTTGSSLADLAVNVATFETQITTTGSYVFVFDGIDWHLDTTTGEIVDIILDYGITFTGTPVADDAITVDYTAGGTTYAWTQTNVQPTSGGLPSQTGNAGKFLTTDGTDASWGYAVTQILIPDTTSNTRWNIGRFGFGGELVITQPHFSSSARLDLYLAYNAVYSAKQGGATLGTNAYSWNNVFTKKINNGADIAVPTTAGTMVVATPPSNDGDYVLSCNVSSGVQTTSWTTPASGTSSISVTLPANGWDPLLNIQRINVTGVTSSSTVIVGAQPNSLAEYTSCGVYCTGQGGGWLSFTCTTTPQNDLTVVVLIM